MQYHTVKTLAERWGVQQRQVLGLIHSADLVAINMASPGASKPTWRITQDAVERFERSRSTAPAPAPTRRRKSAAPVKEFF